MRRFAGGARAVSVLALGCSAIAASLLLGAAPNPALPSFSTATEQRLSNGVIIASQPAGDLPLIGAQIFLPAGLAQQPSSKAGVAALAAAVVTKTQVEGSATLSDVVSAAGGSITYTLDPFDTRFYLECRQADFARLLHDFRQALARPDLVAIADQRSQTLSSAKSFAQSPIEMAYAMVRQVNYSGNGFAFPDQGSTLTISRVTRSDVSSFLGLYQRASGTIVALGGAVTQSDLDAAAREFGSFASGGAQPAASARPLTRTHQVVAHRSVAAPWIAVAYRVPDQYSPDFATMLVIQALLGSGGDAHAFAFSSNGALPQDYVGAYYQYEASPGSMIVFLGGESANIDQSVRDLETGIARLRGSKLSPALVDEAKKSALGDYYMSATSLSDQAWLLGRSAASPQGVSYENLVPQRILAVSSADIQRVSQRYLVNETVAVVLPESGG